MIAKPDDLVVNAWKRQVVTAFRVVEAITEESRKVHEFQLTAAVETHASAVATRERFETATDAQELWRIQGEWWSGNLNRSLAYWREVYEATARTQVCVARCLGAPVAEGPTASTSNVALFDMMGDAYKRWLETAGRMYTPPVATDRKAA